MIPKPFDQINDSDIDALLAQQVREGKTLDYKRDLPGGADADKKEFLADVSSFANTAGGDVIFGVEESGGIATRVHGVSSPDLDAEIRRLDSIIAAGTDPRFQYAIRHIDHSASGKPLLLVRIEQSWLAPHRVVFKGHDKFYARNSAGKYELDVTELRQAFLASSAAADRIRDFRTNRLAKILSGETPVPLGGKARLVLHLVPLEAYVAQKQVDALRYYNDFTALEPMAASGWSRRINLDGVATYTKLGTENVGYTQLFRNGTIESVDGVVLSHEWQGQRLVPSAAYEDRLVRFVPKYLQVQKTLGLSPPVYIFVSLLGIKGHRLGVTESASDFEERYPFDTDSLLLPEAVVSDFSDDIAVLLRPLFDMVWNAAGYPASRNFDNDGKWKPRT